MGVVEKLATFPERISDRIMLRPHPLTGMKLMLSAMEQLGAGRPRTTASAPKRSIGCCRAHISFWPTRFTRRQGECAPQTGTMTLSIFRLCQTIIYRGPTIFLCQTAQNILEGLRALTGWNPERRQPDEWLRTIVTPIADGCFHSRASERCSQRSYLQVYRILIQPSRQHFALYLR